MADSKTYTISTITRGMCLETRSNGSVSTGKYDGTGKTQAQLWTIEKSEDEKSFAFRNMAVGRYLRSAGKGDGAKAQTGDKTWWTLESGDSPGSWWLRSDDFGNYLNNYYGKQTPNNTVQMWSSNLQGWNYTLMWYINEYESPGSFSLSENTDSAALENEKEELNAKAKALSEHEQQVEADEKAVLERENAAVEREKAVAAREQKAETRVKAIAGIEASTKQRSQDMEEKERALAERTQKLEERERAVADKESEGAESAGGSTQVADLQRQLTDTQHELEEAKAAQTKQAEELKRTEAEMKDAAPSNGELEANDEVTKLREKIKELEAQLAGPTPSTSTKRIGSVERERQGLKPIVVQNDFGFLPRKADSKLRSPLPTTLPPKTLPPQDMPPQTQPSKTLPPTNLPRMASVR